MCNCKATEIILGLVVLIFAFYRTVYSKWILVIAAILLILHGLLCNDMNLCCASKVAPAKKAAKRRKK